MAGSIFEPHPQNFAKSYNFCRSTNDVTIIFPYTFCFQIYKKSVWVLRPYLETSLYEPIMLDEGRNIQRKVWYFVHRKKVISSFQSQISRPKINLIFLKMIILFKYQISRTTFINNIFRFIHFWKKKYLLALMLILMQNSY